MGTGGEIGGRGEGEGKHVYWRFAWGGEKGERGGLKGKGVLPVLFGFAECTGNDELARSPLCFARLCSYLAASCVA